MYWSYFPFFLTFNSFFSLKLSCTVYMSLFAMSSRMTRLSGMGGIQSQLFSFRATSCVRSFVRSFFRPPVRPSVRPSVRSFFRPLVRLLTGYELTTYC